MKLLIIFGFILALKVLINAKRLLETKFYHQKYKDYQNLPNHEKNSSINKYCTSVGRLFNIANTQIAFVVSNPFQTNIYKDWITNQLDNSQFCDELNSRFERTKGFFKAKVRESFNPLYWLFLPRHILDSLNSDPDNKKSKEKGNNSNLKNVFFQCFKFLLQILYWFVATIFAYFIEYYLDNNKSLQDLLLKLF